jgi:hypothetical protein
MTRCRGRREVEICRKKQQEREVTIFVYEFPEEVLDKCHSLVGLSAARIFHIQPALIVNLFQVLVAI